MNKQIFFQQNKCWTSVVSRLFVLWDSKALQHNNWWLKITYYDESKLKKSSAADIAYGNATCDDIESVADMVL